MKTEDERLLNRIIRGIVAEHGVVYRYVNRMNRKMRAAAVALEKLGSAAESVEGAIYEFGKAIKGSTQQ